MYDLVALSIDNSLCYCTIQEMVPSKDHVIEERGSCVSVKGGAARLVGVVLWLRIVSFPDSPLGGLSECM